MDIDTEGRDQDCKIHRRKYREHGSVASLLSTLAKPLYVECLVLGSKELT